MQQTITTWLPWVLSAITIASTILTGNKHRSAWLVSLCGQAGWAVYIVAAHAWGFAPLTATLTVLYWRNHRKWKQEEPDPWRDAIDEALIYNGIDCTSSDESPMEALARLIEVEKNQ